MRIRKTIRLNDLGIEVEALETDIQKAVTDCLNLDRMKLTAMAFCPTKSGSLMGTIRVEQRGFNQAALVAGNVNVINPQTGRPVDYARHVHDGTSKMPGRPFLTQAVLLEKYNFQKEILARTAAYHE